MNETAIITGASSGIGEFTAYKFASEGYDLLLIGRSIERLEKVKNQCQKNSPEIKVAILSVDLKNFSAAAMNEKLQKLSQVSVLVNNAGIYKKNGPDDSDFAIWNEIFETNLLGSVKVSQAVWPYFKKNKKGSIVNVASSLGIKPIPTTSAYSSLKAAMINWTMSLAQEGAEFNIRANCVCPGLVETPIHDFYNAPAAVKESVHKMVLERQLLQKIGRPEYIAESIFFFGSDKSTWTTGTSQIVDGGITIK